MKMFLFAGLGSFVGGGLRFILQKNLAGLADNPFPYPTLIINVLGCFLIGIVYALSSKYNFLSVELRTFLTVGFCGGFTTFSTFTNESYLMFKEGNLLHLSLYILLSVILCLIFTFLGYLIIK